MIGIREQILAKWFRRGWRGFLTVRKILGFPASCLIPARTSYGTVFELDTFGYIDACVLREDYYESEVLEAMRELSRPGDVVWDVGANLGLHAVTLASLHPELKVLAFEPAPTSAARVLRNAVLSSSKVDLLTIGLSDRNGFADLYLATSGNSGQTTLTPWSGATYTGRCRIAVATADSLVAVGDVPPPAVIKIDVEGHEKEVLLGMPQVLGSGRCRAVIFEDDCSDDSTPKRILRESGFRVRPLSRREATGHPLANFLATR